MRIIFCYLTIIILFFSAGCSSWRQMLVKKGDNNNAAENAITDFLQTCKKLNNEDKTFYILIQNVNKKIIFIGIIGDDNELLIPGPMNKIGTNHEGFPTHCIERNGKLFYWYDPDSFITQELINTLSRYHKIDSMNVNGFVSIPEFSRDDSKKGAAYYFCKNNLRKYKKIISNRWNKIPKLNCYE